MVKYSFPDNGTHSNLKPVIKSHLQKMKSLLHIAKQSLYNFITVYEKQNNYPSVIGACIYNSINDVYIRHSQVLLLTVQNQPEGEITKYRRIYIYCKVFNRITFGLVWLSNFSAD
jgi:predicted regulator of amino acid metabolism with ACT domain